MRILFLIIACVSFINCGGGGDSSIAGIDASKGCGEFSGTGDAEVSVLKNTCPFKVGNFFNVNQNGCSLTISGLATNGTDIKGVVDDDGYYGFEIIQIEGNRTWACVSDFEQNSGYSYQVNCESGADFCQIAGD